MDSDTFVPALGFGWLTPAYDSIVRYTTREGAFKTALLDGIDLHEGECVLDLGCGTGTLAIMIRARQPYAIVNGLDADAQILSIARKKAIRFREEIHFDEGMSNNLPYPDGTFACVVSSLFFHHLTPADKRSTLNEIKRILRPHGWLHIADWSRPSNRLMQVLSTSVTFLDGRETAGESFEGKLLDYVTDAGFTNVKETAAFDTVFGTIRLLEAQNREGSEK